MDKDLVDDIRRRINEALTLNEEELQLLNQEFHKILRGEEKFIIHNQADIYYSNICIHEWKNYSGLVELFTYCKKCNIKKEK